MELVPIKLYFKKDLSKEIIMSIQKLTFILYYGDLVNNLEEIWFQSTLDGLYIKYLMKKQLNLVVISCLSTIPHLLMKSKNYQKSKKLN